MSSDNLSRIERIFHEALELGEDARNRYLAAFPPADSGLVSEVRSLLKAYHASPELLDSPVFELGLAAFEEPDEESLTGQTIGAYEIQDLIGKGGMGNVYLADDLRLDRKVALKFLSPELLNDNWAKRQFVREAKAVAMLHHPNICPVYGYEEIGEHRFIIMQYVEGVSLAELVRDQKLDEQKMPQFAFEIVEAIAEAHSHGIIHRDIKPGNVMVGTDGHVKVLDFGLAKFVHANDGNESRNPHVSQFTNKGLILGTIAYMSPEQLRAEKLDFRSDIFSIGTLLFELMSGEHPFSKTSDAETISSIIDKRSQFDQSAVAKLPARFRYPIKRCLEKQKEKRYQSATELAIDLQVSKPSPVRDLSRYYWRGLVAILVILAAFVGLFYLFRTPKGYSMIVMPYKNETGSAGLDYLGEGIAESLTQKLLMGEKVKLKTVATMSHPEKGALDPLILGRENNVEFVLSGRITQQNDQLMLRTDVLDIADGIAVRTWTIPFRIDELSGLEDKVASELYAGLNMPDGLSAAVALKRRGASTDNSEALKQYYLGRYLWKKRDRENIKLAIAAFERSIALDPGYSRSHSGLADCYVLLNLVAYGTVPTAEAMTKAKAAARQALELDPYDAPAHTSLGVVLTKYDWNWSEAEKEFRLAIQTDAELASAHYWYSGLLAILGRADESVSAAKKAKDLDPFFPPETINLARTYYYAGQYDKALETLNSLSGTDLADRKVQYLIGLVYLQKGMYRDAQQIFEEISRDNKLFGAAALGYTYAKLGRRNDALKIISELKKAENYVPPQEMAIIYIGLVEKDKALRYLNESFKERHGALISLRVEPLFDSLRGDPKFGELLKAMALQ
jgi:tetratricopeptide (TPR) repeat protein/tRNA A-37 threonylcarbamoyl transferase component Bud32/TolB-like protein